ncbi:ribonuclease H-like domain-containing protein [Tanacetum coccineum]
MEEELAQRLFEEEQAQFKKEQRIARERAAEQEAKDAALIDQIRRNTHKPRRAKIGQDSEIPQSSGTPKKVGDEAVYTGEDDRVVRAATTASSLEAEQESGNIHKTRPIGGAGSEPIHQDTTLGGAYAQTWFETVSKKFHDPPLSEGNTSGSGEDSMEHQVDLMNFVPPTPYDSPLSGGHTPGSNEGRPNFNELINLCIQLSNRVLALENSKTAQDLVIQQLKKKVKRLEKALRARNLGMKLFKISTFRRKGLDKENVSKQGRKSDKTKPMFNDSTHPDLELYLTYKMSGEEPAPQIAPVESPQMISTIKLPMLKKDENGAETEVPPKTAQALLQRQKERKAKSTLLLAIPDEYQLRFHGIKDSKTLWATIKSGFGGNVESKKMQKNVLKQQFENFSVSDTEGLDKAYDRSSPNSQNVAFLSARDTNSINEVNTINGVSTVAGHSSQGQATSSSYTNDLMFSFFADQSSGPQLNDEDLEQLDQDNLEEMDIKWQVAMLSMRVKCFYKKTGRKLIFNGKEPIGFDKAKVECFNCHRRGHFSRECKAPRNQWSRNRDTGYRSRDNTRRTIPVETSNALVVQDNALIVQDGLGYDWSYIAQDEPTEFALMAYTSNSSGSDTEVSDDEEDIFQSEDSQTTVKPSFKKIEFTKARNVTVKTDKQAVKPRMVTQSPKRMPKESVLRKGIGHKAVRPIWNNTQRINHQNKFVLTAVLTRSGRIPVSTAKQYVNTATQASAGCGNPQQALKYKGMFDSGCSRHMTGNKALLTDYQDIDGGFVAFGGNTRGGKITGIGKIRTNKIDFEDVFFVKELKFNLFSVSQMCDKKNSILFTETECLVLSPDFKLIDESQVLLRVPRQNNMYSFDLKNVVPSGDLTCLFAKAIIDESKLWHRRLGHVNFKTMNKLVKGNLEYSVARTPQQNGVAERKNKALIEAAKTMLTDSLLPTVFWAEAVNTACYVLNRVLVTKPHNNTPYELIIGRAPSISFMRHFGCPVTILNTLDPLGKFDGKAEEGFLVGYSVNSKAFRVFNTKTRKVKENLHVNFLENKPNVAGQGPNWLFDIDSLTNSMNYQPVSVGNQTNKNAGPQETNGNTGLKKNVDAGQTEEENVSTQQYIVFPLWSSISSSYKSSDDKAKDYTVDDDACRKIVQEPTSEYDQALKNVLDKMMDQEKEATKQSDAVRKEFEAHCDSQEKITRASSTNSFNAVSTPVNTASASRTFSPVGPSSGPSFIPFGESFPIDVANLPHDPLMPELEDTAEIQSTSIFGNAYDDHDLETLNTPYADQSVGAVANFNNMEPSIVVSPIPTT